MHSLHSSRILFISRWILSKTHHSESRRFIRRKHRDCKQGVSGPDAFARLSSRPDPVSNLYSYFPVLTIIVVARVVYLKELKS